MGKTPKKILIIGTGGTIACVKGESIRLESAFKILDYTTFDGIEFDCVSPYFILSENTDFDCWKKLINAVKSVDFEKYSGVIILHGSDTLSYTGALIANMFYGKPIVIVASDKPIEDKTANGIDNFNKACEYIINSPSGVRISYNGLHSPENKPRLTSPCFKRKNILIITPYVGIDYASFSLDGVDAVLHKMYHSATAPESVNGFIDRCKRRNIPFYFVSENETADYESAKDFENIILSSTVESAYARLLLS